MMFKFRNWFVFAASLLVFFVVCEGRPTKKANKYSAAAVKSAVAVALTAAEKQSVVDRHNYHRRKEGASNMQKMKWNEYLADMATEWASKCIFEHGQPSRPAQDLPFTFMGQNLYKTTKAQSDLTQGIDRYFGEKKDYNYDTNSCGSGKICGHYTQVVWSSSTDVGCGIANCTSSTGSWWNHVCNYGPGGNWVGEKPYEKGPACSKCDVKQLCDDGLCK